MSMKNNNIPASEANKTISINEIEDMIFNIRGVQVMLDSDLAQLYGVETKRINEQVKRNIERFPKTFRFQLSDNETNELVANCDRLQNLKHSSFHPYVFTEQGVAMLSTVLRSQTAITVSIQIMDAFVDMRHFLVSNSELFHRVTSLEKKQFPLHRQSSLPHWRITQRFR